MTTFLLRKKRFWLGIAFTLAFLYVVFRKVDFPALILALLQADYYWILPALVVYLFGYMVRAIRWQYLISSIKVLAWQKLFPPLILSFMVNNVLPARAGEFVGAYVVGKQTGLSKSSVFATVVMQRVYDGLVMVMFAVLVLGCFKIIPTSSNAHFVAVVNWVVKLTALVFVLLFALLFVLITWKERSNTVVQVILSWLPLALRRPLERISHSFIDGLAVLRHRRDSIIAFVLSILAWSCESAAYWLVLQAFHLSLPIYAAVMLMAVVNLGIMIPSSPGYIGPFEFFGVGTLLLFGVKKIVSLPCILVIHVLIWLPITLWGFYYMWTMKLSFSEMEAAAPPAASTPA